MRVTEQGAFSLVAPIDELGLPSYLQNLPEEQLALARKALHAIDTASSNIPRRDQRVSVNVFSGDRGIPLLVVTSSAASSLRFRTAELLPKMTTAMTVLSDVNGVAEMPIIHTSNRGRSIHIGFVEK